MRKITFNLAQILKLNFFITFFLLITYSASAQFYTKHYIAPAPWQYFSKANEIVISTNSITEVTITLTKSDGTFEATLKAKKGTPAVYRFKLFARDLPMNALDKVLNGAGLIITSDGPTAVNLRNVASDDYFEGENVDANIKGNAALTSFGDAGLGIRFRVGYYRDGGLGNFGSLGEQYPIYSVMATANNTSVKINNVVKATLNAGQSYLFKSAVGTLVETSNPSVMNTSAAIDMPGGCGDGAFNQIPPEAVLGTEYFLERGTGNDIAEQTTVVATKDNTNLTINGYSTTGVLVSTANVNLAVAGNFYTFKNGIPNNGNSVTSFTSSRVLADKRVAVYTGTAQSCEVDISTIAPVSECGGSNFIETTKFKNYSQGTLDYFGYILLRSASETVTVNGNNIASISGVGARFQIGTTGWYLINFNSVQIGSPEVLSIASNAKLTVSIVQQAGGFSMAGFFSNFAAQPEDPTLTYISGGGCTNNKAELTTPTGFAPYQWYYNGTAITGANAATYTATKTGSYSVSSTLACGSQTPSKPVSVTLCSDLGITKTVDNATPCIGSNVEFTVKVSNLGGNNVSGVSVNDLLPSGYTFVSSTPSVGSYDGVSGVWSIGDVEAQTSITLKIIATVNASGNYTNTAALPATIDTNTANNSASAAVNPKLSNLVITNPAAVCPSFTVDLTASAITAGSSSNMTLSYWTNAAATTAYTTPTATTAGTYYIKAISADGCVFVKPVVVTNNAVPNTPTISTSGSTTCVTGSVTLTSSGSSGSFLWSNGETTQSINVTTGGSYTVKRINSSGCESISTATAVTFKPSAPAASAQTFCSSENKKVNNLVASGSGIKWYNAPTGGALYTGTEALVNGTTYYGSQTVNNCESDSRTGVTVTINSISSAPTASPQTFCAADAKKISDLVPSGSTIKWYDALTGGTQYPSNQTLTSGDYYVSQTLNSCGESARTLVVVTINNVPSAPIASPQTFCATDSKKVSDLVPSGSNIKWYDNLTGGTQYALTQTLSNGTYYAAQTNTCGESTRTAVVVTVNNTAAPTASPQTFCATDAKKVNDLVPSGSGIKWYSAATGGTLYSGTELLSSGNYYVSKTSNGCESLRTSVAVTVNNTAAPTASAQNFCSSDAKKVSDLVPSGSGIKWYNASTGGAVYLGTETLSSGSYYVSQTLNGCESTRTLVSVTVNPTPTAPTISADNATTFCSGGNVILTSSGGNSYLWSNGATTQSITVNASGNYKVQIGNASGCLSAASAATTVTVNPIPSAPAASAQTFCSADAKKVNDLVPSGSGIKWYSALTGGTLYAGTETLVTGTYFVSQTTDGCESARTSTAVTVNTTPSAPTASPQTFCSADAKKVNDLVPSGSGIKWYSALTGGTLYAGTETLVTGTYFVSQTTDGCESARTSTAVTVNTTPSAPTASAQTFCSADAKKVNDLVPSGSGIKWYSALTGGTLYADTETLVTGTYFVSQTTDGCESARTSTAVTVNTTPSAPTASAQTFCSADAKKVNDLVPSGSGIKWYSALTGGTLYAGTETLVTGTYFVSQTTDGCESARTSTAVTVNTTPSAPTASPQTFCSADAKKVNDLVPSGSGIKWYSALTGGTLYAGTETLVTGTYFVSQTTDGCESARTSTAVTVNTTPSAPTASAQTFCSADAKKVNDLVPSGSGIKWYSALTGGTLYADTETLVTGTYFVSQTTDGCESARTSTAVTVNTTPSAPTASAQTFCSADAKKVNDLVPSGSGIKWYSALTGGTLYAGTETLVTGTYFVSQTTDGCESARTSTAVTVNTTPSAPTVDIINQLTCAGSTGSVELSGLPTGTWTINPGNITGNTTTKIISGLLPGNTYNYTVTTSLGCKSLASSDITISDFICAVDDTPASISAVTGGTTSTVFVNDKINGSTFLPVDVSLTTSVLPTGVTFNSDGTITVAANTTAGTYAITYTICKSDNTNVCDSAVVTLTVLPIIDAVTENLGPINGVLGGKTTSVITGDTFNGVQAVIGIGSGKVSLSGTAPAGLTLNADGTITVDVNTPIGNYAVVYTICDNDHAANCDTVTSYVAVTGDTLVANADPAAAVKVSNQTQTIINALDNDTRNGSPATASAVTISPVNFDSANPLVINTATGEVTLKADTPAGTYTLEYSICDKLNTTNCASASVTLTVLPIIDAVTENLGPINGVLGGKTASIITGDTFNGVQAVIGTGSGKVSLSGTAPAGLTLNADGTITVDVNTPIGNYAVVYTICDNDHASNCDTVTSYVAVTGDTLVANADPAATVKVSNQTQTIINALDNDTRNGSPITASAVTISPVNFDSSNPLVINTATGEVTLKADTPAGTYTLEYSICDKLNTTNCASASVTLIVLPIIDAVTENLGPINGVLGGKTTSVISGDTFNGVQAVIGTGSGKVSLSGTAPSGLTLNADGTITVDVNTPIGNYAVVYTICDNDHASNCDTVTSYVAVTGDTLVANADPAAAVKVSNQTQTIINALDNDTRNGSPATASAVTISTVNFDSANPLVINTATGEVTLKADTPAGTYTLEYSICDKLNTTNCASASVTLTVLPIIDAVTENLGPINGVLGGKTTSVITGDTFNGVQAVIGIGSGKVSLSGTAPAGLTLNADGTITVDVNTPIGNYAVVYTICDNDHAANCDTVTSYVAVTGDTLVANADPAAAVKVSNQTQTIINALDNDTRNGSPATASAVTISTVNFDSANPLVINTATGEVTLKADTPAGTYTLEYSICDKLNTTNCASASVTLTVLPIIDAVTENLGPINGVLGGKTTSVISGDTFNGVQAVIGTGSGKVSLSGTAPSGLTLNADGTITVDVNTPIGNYAVVYTICDNDHAANCDTVTSYVAVTGDTLVANADPAAVVKVSNQTQTIINALDNDTRNGSPITASAVTISTVNFDSSNPLVINTATGEVTLKADTPAGTYTLEYSICDKLNTTNCASASVTLTVLPIIDAVTENLGPINGVLGGKTTSVISGDTFNGVQAVIGTGSGKVSLSGTAPSGLTLNADGTITVDVNTPIGNYAVVYTICDNDHASNCDTVTSYVAVTGASLILVDDIAGPIAGVNHPTNVLNVLSNDTKNGLPITANDVSLSQTIADPAGYLTLNPDGTVILKENAPAGTYELTYQVCDLNTTNCSTAIVKVNVVLPTMTITANSYCSNNVPYVTYSVAADNFVPTNLLTVKWIDSANNIVLTQTDLPLSGNILWPGAAIDANGNGVDWPGWIVTNGQWAEGADGFEKTRPGVTMQFSLNPTVNVLVSYPAATSDCNARPTFTIKANDDISGPIDTTKEVNTSLNVFNNDELNVLPINPANVVLSTIIPNDNLILNADGSVDVKSKTPSGVYQLTYQICDLSSSSNCSQAIVKVTVVNSVKEETPSVIKAVNDPIVSVDGINGSLEFINVLDNDLIDGLPINPTRVLVSNTPANSYFEFNADGTVNVKPNTPGGNYALPYQVCEKASAGNCATAVLNVFVEVPSIAIVKTAVFNDENNSGYANAGETITYKFTVTNTGNVPLTGVTITDPLEGVVVSGQALNLAVGESNDNNFTALYKITQADINRGNISNQATVQGRSERGVLVDDKSDDSSNSGDKPTVLDLQGCVIKVFNAFSPNGDSKNTRFYIQGLECYPDNTVEIYNRWGILVYNMDHYNNEDKAFKGFSEGRATVKQADGLPVGTYYYILKYKDSDSKPHELTGYLYINK